MMRVFFEVACRQEQHQTPPPKTKPFAPPSLYRNHYHNLDRAPISPRLTLFTRTRTHARRPHAHKKEEEEERTGLLRATTTTTTPKAAPTAARALIVHQGARAQPRHHHQQQGVPPTDNAKARTTGRAQQKTKKMKLIAVAMFRQGAGASGGAAANPIALGMAADLSGFGYFQRASVREMISFLARTIVQRTQPGTRQTVRQDDYYCHVVCHAGDGPDGGGGLAGVAVTDRDYPATAAFCVVAKAIEELESGVPAGAAAAAAGAGGEAGAAAAAAGPIPPYDWRGATEDCEGALPVLESCLLRYQDPAAADKLTKIQRDLDETKVILHQTIDSVLRRGEKLDALVDKSADLSLASQMFYKQARRTNSCCKMM